MANEVFDGSDVICQLLGERKRLSDQARDSLPQGTVKSFDMIGDALLLFDHPMLLLWNHTLVCLPPICIKGRISTRRIYHLGSYGQDCPTLRALLLGSF